MAQIGWIDFSKSQKDRAIAILDLLKPEGRVDELGMGIIRDSLADLLFPGVSTIQTRAKYFYIIPNILWKYFHLPAANKKRQSLSRFLDEKEKLIMWNLAEAYKHEDGHGVIGITKQRGQSIARPPSTIYWNGISTFELIKYNNYSLGSYLNRFSKFDFDEMLDFIPTGDDSPLDDAANRYENNMGVYAPYDPKFEEYKTLELTALEAEDFSNRILRCTGKSLFAELLRNDKLRDIFFKVQYQNREAFLVFAPQAAPLIENKELKRNVELAHDFSLAMYGANIIYNQLIQQQLQSEDTYEDLWLKWIKDIENGFLNIDNLTVEALYQLSPGLKSKTHRFISEWFNLIRNRDFNSNLRFELVERQEYNNKRNKARLRNKNFEDCKKRGNDSWLGFDYLDYRFRNAKVILNDIQKAS